MCLARRLALETHTEGSSLTDPIGVAVIGAGMAGRSAPHAYRDAHTVIRFRDAPTVRLVAIADINADFANHTETDTASSGRRKLAGDRRC